MCLPSPCDGRLNFFFSEYTRLNVLWKFEFSNNGWSSDVSSLLTSSWHTYPLDTFEQQAHHCFSSQLVRYRLISVHLLEFNAPLLLTKQFSVPMLCFAVIFVVASYVYCTALLYCQRRNRISCIYHFVLSEQRKLKTEMVVTGQRCAVDNLQTLQRCDRKLTSQCQQKCNWMLNCQCEWMNSRDA